MSNNFPNVGNSNFNRGSTNKNDNYIPYNEQRLGENYNREKKFNINEANSNNYNSNNYENAFKTLNISDSQDNVKYNKRENFLFISSKDRDISVYPLTTEYVIHLEKEYKNVISVELTQAFIPDKNNVASEPFILLKVKELEPVIDTNNTDVYNSFSILQISPMAAGGYIQTMQVFENITLNYRTPKAKLSTMSISLTDCDGNLMRFGGDGTTDKAFQCQFIFKIITLDTDTRIIGQKNIY